MPRTVRAAFLGLFSVCCLMCCLSRAAHGQSLDDPFAAAISETGEPRETGEPGAEHYFILLFDFPAGGLHQIDELNTAVHGWIEGKLLPGDAVAVASYYGCELQVQQDFTRDRGALAAAIADAVRGRPHVGRGPEDADASLLARLPQAAELSRRTANFYGLLQVLAEAAQGAPGRKNLLVFSKGFGRSHLFEGESGNGPLSSPIQEKYLADRGLYGPTLQALRDAHVNLYPVDLATDYRETYPLAGVMCQLAAASGGRYFYPVNDVSGLLDRVVADETAEVADLPLERSERIAGGKTAAPLSPAAPTPDNQAKGRE
jgi:VWFA-related protein